MSVYIGLLMCGMVPLVPLAGARLWSNSKWLQDAQDGGIIAVVVSSGCLMAFLAIVGGNLIAGNLVLPEVQAILPPR